MSCFDLGGAVEVGVDDPVVDAVRDRPRALGQQLGLALQVGPERLEFRRRAVPYGDHEVVHRGTASRGRSRRPRTSRSARSARRTAWCGARRTSSPRTARSWVAGCPGSSRPRPAIRAGRTSRRCRSARPRVGFVQAEPQERVRSAPDHRERVPDSPRSRAAADRRRRPRSRRSRVAVIGRARSGSRAGVVPSIRVIVLQAPAKGSGDRAAPTSCHPLASRSRLRHVW